MAQSVQILLIICCTIVALAYAFVLLAWVGSKNKK